MGQGRNDGGKGGTIPRVPNHCGGREMTAGDEKKSQQCIQVLSSIQNIASERPQVRTYIGAPN